MISPSINVFLVPFIDKDNSTRKYLNLDWNKLSYNQQFTIKYLSNNCNKYKLEDNGGLGMALFPL